MNTPTLTYETPQVFTPEENEIMFRGVPIVIVVAAAAVLLALGALAICLFAGYRGVGFVIDYHNGNYGIGCIP